MLQNKSPIVKVLYGLGSLSTKNLEKEKEEDEEEDYVYLYDALDNNLFQFQTPESPVPGVGNKNPVPLSQFPATPAPAAEAVFDLGKFPLNVPKFPINVPIPLTEAEKLDFPSVPRRSPAVVSIGTQKESERVADTLKKSKLTVPSIIRLIFGAPTNMSQVRMKIPDFTSSGPVNIPSSIQLYGNIGDYLDSTTTSTTQRPRILRPKPTASRQGQTPMLQDYSPTADFSNNHEQNYHRQHLQSILQQLPGPQQFDGKNSERQQLLHHGEIPREPTLNGEPLTQTKSSVYSNTKRLDTSFLAALVEALEQDNGDQRKNMKPKANNRNRFTFNLPTEGAALPKPQSLLALEAKRAPRPVPIKWNNDKILPTQRLPPFHKEILEAAATESQQEQRSRFPTETANLSQFLRRFSQSPFDSKINRFKSPPMMLPLENTDENIKSRKTEEESFTVLKPQSIVQPRPFRQANTPNRRQSGNRNSSPSMLDMILRHKSFSSKRKRRESEPKKSEFILTPPIDILNHLNPSISVTLSEDTQLRPEDALTSILSNRPEVASTTIISSTTVSTTTTATVSPSTTTKKTILSKPIAIKSAELVVAKPQVFNQIIGTGTSVQTSLIGFPNPFVSTTSSGSISYNKLAIAAALSVVPTLVIAFPFLAPSLGKRRRRRGRRRK